MEGFQCLLFLYSRFCVEECSQREPVSIEFVALGVSLALSTRGGTLGRGGTGGARRPTCGGHDVSAGDPHCSQVREVISLWPSDAIWQNMSWSALVQVMACHL